MYPIRYEADYAEQQGRWRTFFRLILAIPWYILGSIYVIGAFVVAFLAWFAILFTGRYPEGLYNFNAGVLRYLARSNAFFWLQTQEYPPFGLEEAPDYPVRLEVDSPLPKYNRWKAFFRLILGIPAMVVVSILGYVVQLAALVAWLHIVFTERTSGGTHNALSYGIAYTMRANGYFLLLTETLPPVSDQVPAGSLSGGRSPRQITTGSAATAKSSTKPKAATKTRTSSSGSKSGSRSKSSGTSGKGSAARKPSTRKKS